MATGAAKRRITRETVTEVEGEPADDAEEETEVPEDLHLEAPLFSPLLRRAKRIESVGVRRSDPDSGYLGAMPPDVTEATLKTRWGGGTYRLEGKNTAGQIVADGVRTCKLAGDPVFTSELEEKQWRKANGLPDKVAAPAAGALSIKDLLLFLDEKDEKRRTEQLDREDRARKEAAEREERERRARAELDERKQKEADERAERQRLAAREDDERRARQHREDMERLAAQNANALQQTQQFFNQLATTMKAETSAAPATDPIKTLIAGVQLAQQLGGGGGGGGDEGPLSSLIRRLPETLAEVRKTGAAAYAEIKSGRGRTRIPPGQDALTITGPTATKAKAVISMLAKAGKDPEAELNKLLSFAEAAAGGPAAPPAAGGGSPRARRPAAATQVRPRRQAPPRIVVKNRRG